MWYKLGAQLPFDVPPGQGVQSGSPTMYYIPYPLILILIQSRHEFKILQKSRLDFTITKEERAAFVC